MVERVCFTTCKGLCVCSDQSVFLFIMNRFYSEYLKLNIKRISFLGKLTLY